MNDCIIYNCYISPNIPKVDYKAKIDEIMEDVRQTNNPNIIILGDLNAKSRQWSSNVNDERGNYLETWLAILNLIPADCGTTITFVRGNSSLYIDITLATKRVFRRITNWRVSLEESLSLHRNILFEILYSGKKGKTQTIFSRKIQHDPAIIRNAIDILRHNIGESHKKLIGVIKKAQTLSIDRRTQQQKQETYWWNKTVKARRKECNKARRKVTRARANMGVTAEQTEELERQYKQAKTEYRNEIRDSKKEKWKNLIEKLEEDVWGQGFQIVTKQLKRPMTPYDIPPQKKRQLLDELWDEDTETWVAAENYSQCSLDDLAKAGKKIKIDEAAGPDGIQPETVKIAIDAMPDEFIKVFNRILKTQTFPKT